MTRRSFALVSAAGIVHRSARGADRGAKELFSRDNLIAWCIVPFDAKKRGPQERAAMLKKLGITKFAYDWRDKDIPTFDEELDALNAQHIKLQAFWLTSGPKPAEEKNVATVLDFLARRAAKTEIWYLFIPPKEFDTLSQEAKLDMASGAVRYIATRADQIGCSVGLYNHGGWFGEPENEIAIIQRLPALRNIGLVYNFHHGHTQMDRFPELFPKMLPYLKAVNVNGMRQDGPMILPVGTGDRELGMMRVVETSGYRGPIGILGHREDQDAEAMLAGNMAGLTRLAKELRSR